MSFEKDKLGFSIIKNRNGRCAIVSSCQQKDTGEKISIGWRIFDINRKTVENWKHADIHRYLAKQATRPLIIAFTQVS